MPRLRMPRQKGMLRTIEHQPDRKREVSALLMLLTEDEPSNETLTALEKSGLPDTLKEKWKESSSPIG